MANDEHVAMLKQGVAAWNEWRSENRNIHPDLGGADLREAALTKAKLSGAILTGAYFTGANLYMADLTRANLSRSSSPSALAGHARRSLNRNYR
jgi:uncharacterized protein YjbI with pentapeptide repeats